MLLTRRHLLATIAIWTPAINPQQRRALSKGPISMSKPGEYTYKCEFALLVLTCMVRPNATGRFIRYSVVNLSCTTFSVRVPSSFDHAVPLADPRPGMTVDAVIVAKQQPPKLLLIQRKNPPCQVSCTV